MKGADKDIQETQFLEQNLHSLVLQKQAFQLELREIQAALKEIGKSGDEVFQIIGQLMLKKEKSKVKEELLDKEKILDSRIKTMEKQEDSLVAQLDKLRKK